MKRKLIYFTSLFFAVGALETIINQVLLKNLYGQYGAVWRPTEELIAFGPYFTGVYILFTASFGILFQISYKGTGIGEGSYLGLLFGILIKSWYGFTNYIILPISFSLGLLWFFYGTIEVILLGILASYLLEKYPLEKE